MAPITIIDADMLIKWTDDIDRARINLGIQGTSVAVIHKGEIIYAQGFGKRNNTDPFTSETLVPIASITKGFTAATIGELVARDKVKWDVPVSEYLPEFQLKDPRLTSEITFLDLLSHRTGLPSLDFEWHHRTEPPIELIKKLKYVEPEAPLRTKWIYNNAMVAVAGVAAARVAGTSYEQLVLDTVTRPLGMKKTGLSNKKMATKPNHSLPYSCDSFEAAQKGQIHRIHFDTIPLTDAPAGDLHSNVIELANYAKAIMHYGELDGKQVLNKSTVKHMRTAYSIMEPKPRGPEFSIGTYGLCLMIEHYKGHSTVHHSGSVAGYRSNVCFFPDDDLAVINLSNNDVNQIPIWLPYYIADDVLNLSKTRDWLFDVAVTDTKEFYKSKGMEDPVDLEHNFPPQIKDKPATRKLVDFVGEYTHPVVDKISVKLAKLKKAGEDGNETEEEQDALSLRISDFEGILDHYHFDSFRFRVLGETISFALLITFLTGDNGLVEKCRVATDGEPYVFTKVQPDNTVAPPKI